MGLPEDLAFATKGELAVQILCDACADGMHTGFACGDEVYGSCPAQRATRGCREGTGTTVARLTEPRPQTVTQEPELRCPASTGIAQH